MTDFELMVAVWGYAVDGHEDVSARVAENKIDVTLTMWDDPAMLDSTWLNNARPPEYYALYWVCEHERRKDIGWCGA